MNDKQQAIDWATVLDDIEDNSPYDGRLVDGGIELFLAGGDDVPGGVVGIIHTPDEWEQVKHDVGRFGVWPARVSF